MTRLRTAWTANGDRRTVDAGRAELLDQQTAGREEQCRGAALTMDQRHQFGSLEKRLAQGDGDRDDPGLSGSRPRTETSASWCDDPFDKAVEQCLLVADVPVDGGGGHSQLGGQPPDGQTAQPFGLHDLQAGVEHLVTGEGGTGRRRIRLTSARAAM